MGGGPEPLGHAQIGDRELGAGRGFALLGLLALMYAGGCVVFTMMIKPLADAVGPLESADIAAPPGTWSVVVAAAAR